MLTSVAVVLVLWGPAKPPDCPRLGPPIEVWASTVDAAIAKAQARAEKRGADTIYVIKTEPRGGYQYLRAGAMRCEVPP